VLVDTIHGQSERFESASAPRRVRLERRDYPGERRLDAYRISPAQGTAQGTFDPPPAELIEIARYIAAHPANPLVEAILETTRTTTDTDGGGYMRLGMALAQRGRVALAAAALDVAVARYPGYLVDLLGLKTIFLDKEKFASLMNRVISRMKTTPEQMPGLQQMFESVLTLEEIEVLSDTCRRLIHAFPNYALAYAYLGRVQSYIGNYDGAMHNLERALALDPVQYGRVYCVLGDLYLGTGRCSDALRLLEQGFKHAPNDSGLVLLLADAHINCGDAERAVTLTTEELGREAWANRVSSDAAVSGKAENAVPEAYLDLARAIFAHAEDPAVATFREVLRKRIGMGDSSCLQLGVDLARRGRLELAATVLDALVGSYPGHMLDLVSLQSCLSGVHAVQP
jgi:tetratricopeptide (TPR) repeat protein